MKEEKVDIENLGIDFNNTDGANLSYKEKTSETKETKEKKNKKRKKGEETKIEEKPEHESIPSENEFGAKKTCPCNRKTLWIIVGISSAIVVLAVLAIIIVFVAMKPKTKKEGEVLIPGSNEINYEPNELNPEDERPIQKEFEILTKPGELKQITVVQKSKEETKLNDVLIKSDIILVLKLGRILI